MIVQVDPHDPTPVYQQLRTQISQMVASGVLEPGTRLPTIRQLAADLGLAKGTVAKAYETLLGDGVLEAAGRRGTVVASSPILAAHERRARLMEAARRLALTGYQLGIGHAEIHAALDAALVEVPSPPSHLEQEQPQE